MRDLHLTLLARKSLRDRETAERLLRTVFQTHPDLLPRRYGNHEPLPFKLEGPVDYGALMTPWHTPFLWTQGRRTDGYLSFGSPHLHDRVILSCTSSRVHPDLLSILLRQLTEQVAPDFAYVYFQVEDKEAYLQRLHAVSRMCSGVTTHDLKRSVPDLAWATVLGPPYVGLFSPALLATCPAHVSIPLAPDVWYIQLTSDAFAASHTPMEYVRVRESVKAHLGFQHFLDLASPEHQQVAPPFEWATPVHNGLLSLLREKNLLES